MLLKTPVRFSACILAIVVIFLLDVASQLHALATLGYFIIIIYILRFPSQKTHALILSALASAFIIVDYLWSLTDGMHIPVDRLLSILTIWMTVYFSARYKNLLDKDSKHKSQLHAVFNNATEAILIINAAGKIVLANLYSEKLFGFNEGELAGKNVDTLVPEGLRTSHRSHREAFMANPKNRPLGSGIELVARHKNSREFPVEISLNHFENVDGKFAIAFVIDLTEKKKIEENLHREQKLAKTYFDLAPILFVALDETGNVMSINDYGCDLLGYLKKDTIGKNWFKTFLGIDVRDELQDHFNSILKGPASEWVFENPVLNKLGEQIEISWKTTVFKDHQNRTIVLSAGTDITARKKHEKVMYAHHQAIQNINDQLERGIRERTAELNKTIRQLESANQELEKNQKLLKTIVHNFPDGLIGILDKNMRYVFADGQEMEQFGLNGQGNAGERVFDNIHPALSKEAEEKLKAVFMGTRVAYDVEMNDKAYTVNSAPIAGLNNTVNEIIVVIKNNTDRKRIEKELQKSIEKEQELSKMKTQFVATASHEFRTPLTTILSSAFLLENYTGTELENKKTTHINKIKQSVNNLTDLLNDFMLLGKLEEGKIRVCPSEIDIREFLEGLVPEIELVRKGGQRVICEYSGNGKVVQLDKQLLRGILLNLVGNAIKYSPANAIVNVNVLITPETLTLQVIDHGIGIPQEEQPNVFKRFYRAQNALNIEGTGLGLNIARKHVMLMNGTIEFESKLNEGTTFTVTLPLDRK